jgi:enterochelin esterase-like enzyme
VGTGRTISVATAAQEHAVRTDALASWWTVAVLALLGATALVVAWRRGHRPRGERRRRWPLVVTAVLLVVAAVAVGVNRWQGYLPNVAAVRIHLGIGTDLAVPAVRPAPDPAATVAVPAVLPAHEAGTAGSVTIPVDPDHALDPTRTWIYTPPGFDPSGSTLYPLVVLIHGSPGGSADWFGAGLPAVMDSLITSGTVRPMIVVSPDVNARGASESACLDSTRGGSQVETYLRRVVVPWVEQRYPIATDRTYQAIGGMSSGAYCALDQGLRHSDDIGTILAIMPYDRPGAGAETELSTPQEIAAHSPADYVRTIGLTTPTAVFLDRGGDEGDAEVIRSATELAAALEARGQPVELRVETGVGHSWAAAMVALPHALEFFERQMAAAPASGGTVP